MYLYIYKISLSKRVQKVNRLLEKLKAIIDVSICPRFFQVSLKSVFQAFCCLQSPQRGNYIVIFRTIKFLKNKKCLPLLLSICEKISCWAPLASILETRVTFLPFVIK